MLNKCTQNETAYFTRAAGELVAAAIKEHLHYQLSDQLLHHSLILPRFLHRFLLLHYFS